MLIIRSLLFNLVMFITAVIYAGLAVFTFPFDALTRYRLISHWAKSQIWLLKVLCGLHYQVEGMHNLPQTPSVILAKHQSSWETLAFQEIFPPQVWVLKRELLFVPFFGWGLAMTRPIAIDRAAPRKGLEQIVEQGRERLQSGRWVVVFPEGTRLPPRQQRRFGIGGALLGSEAGCPIVPVAHNAGSYWPRRGFIKRPGTIRVVIGPPIDGRGKNPKEINRLAEDWIAATMVQLEGPA